MLHTHTCSTLSNLAAYSQSVPLKMEGESDDIPTALRPGYRIQSDGNKRYGVPQVLTAQDGWRLAAAPLPDLHEAMENPMKVNGSLIFFQFGILSLIHNFHIFLVF